MVLQARRRLPGRDLVLVADRGFSALAFLDAMRRGGVAAIPRPAPGAALHEPAPPRPGRPAQAAPPRPPRPGRPAQAAPPRPPRPGRPAQAAPPRPPRPAWARSAALARRARVCPLCETSSRPSMPAGKACGWRAGHGAGERAIEIASATAVRRHAGLPVVPIRRGRIRDPERRFAPPARLGTDPARDPAQIVAWAVAALVRRAHLPGGARASGRRDAAAVVRQGHRAHDAVPARPVLRGGAPGGSPPRPRAATGRGHGVVRQGSAYLQRRPGRRAPGDLARAGFGDVRAPKAPNETSPQPAGAMGPRPPPRRLNGRSRAERPGARRRGGGPGSGAGAPPGRVAAVGPLPGPDAACAIGYGGPEARERARGGRP